LQKSAHLSPADRLQLFHKRFGEKQIKLPSTIRCIPQNPFNHKS
jgi:hypothetical protein